MLNINQGKMEKQTQQKLIAKLQKMAKRDVPFWEQMEEARKYESNPDNHPKTNIPLWNISCTMRDLSMYVNLGAIPTRGWKVSHVKHYFGIKGSGENLLNNFLEIYDTIMPLYSPTSYEKNHPEKWEELNR